MKDRFPLTVTQLRQAKEDLAAMQQRAEEISRLMTAGYGPADPKAIRAGEVHSAIQRLQWELERSGANAVDATTEVAGGKRACRIGGGASQQDAWHERPQAFLPKLSQRRPDDCLLSG